MYSVSVIMPVYNNEKTLRQAIDSILNQTIFDLELILINDGSTDASAQICDEYARKEPLLVEVIHQEKRGIGLARNRGLFKSTGRYIYFADAHHVFNRKMLEDNVVLANEKEAEVVVFGFTDKSKKSSEGNAHHLPRMPHLLKQETFRNHYRNFHHFNPYELSNKIYLRNYLKEHRIKFYNHSYNEAPFFNLSVYKNLSRVAFNRISYCTHGDLETMQAEISSEQRYEVNVARAKQLEEVLTYWNREKDFRDLIINEYYQVILLEIENICKKDSHLTASEQQNKVQTILMDDTVVAYVKEMKISDQKSSYLKALLMTIQNRNPKGVIQVVTGKNGTQEVSFKISSFFSKLFNR